VIAGDNWPQPVGCRWTTSSPACGSRICPQPVEIFRPRIHNHLTWSDGLSPAAPVDTIWTTSQSPGCGRKKVAESVEGGRNSAGIRTAGGRRGGAEGRRTSSGATRIGSGSALEGPHEAPLKRLGPLQSGSRAAPERRRFGSGPLRVGWGPPLNDSRIPSGRRPPRRPPKRRPDPSCRCPDRLVALSRSTPGVASSAFRNAEGRPADGSF
jgi:hypothetical protein